MGLVVTSRGNLTPRHRKVGGVFVHHTPKVTIVPRVDGPIQSDCSPSERSISLRFVGCLCEGFQGRLRKMLAITLSRARSTCRVRCRGELEGREVASSLRIREVEVEATKVIPKRAINKERQRKFVALTVRACTRTRQCRN